jgi:O-antigen chain-terminating methyltransferase
LPSQLNRFPFNRSKTLQQFVLKIIELLFRDQRSVNYSLIQALKEVVKINHKLNERTTVIQTQLTEVRNLIEMMHKQVETIRAKKDKVQEQIESEGKL